MERTRRTGKMTKTQAKKRRRRKFPNVFFKKEIRALFGSIDNPRTMIASFLAFYCALRISEVCALKWDDVDLENKRLKVVDGKNHKDGFVPLSSVCVPILEKWKLMNPDSEYLFSTETYDKPHYTSDALYRDYRHALKRAGLSIKTEKTAAGVQQHQYKFHTLRHSRCTHLLNNGVPIERVQHFMRHDKIETTLTYTWILDTELNKMVEDVDKPSARVVESSGAISVQEDPLDIAKRRLAYGEITPKEFERIIAVLQVIA